MICFHESYRGMSALHIASIYGKEDIVDLLLNNNATVDIWSGQGYTPIMLASGEGNLNIVEKLLTKGADLNAKDQNRYSYLKYSFLLHVFMISKSWFLFQRRHFTTSSVFEWLQRHCERLNRKRCVD